MKMYTTELDSGHERCGEAASPARKKETPAKRPGNPHEHGSGPRGHETRRGGRRMGVCGQRSRGELPLWLGEVCLSTWCLSCLTARPFMYIPLSVYPLSGYLCLFIPLSLYLLVCFCFCSYLYFFVSLPGCTFVFLFVDLSVYLPLCLSLALSLRPARPCLLIKAK